MIQLVPTTTLDCHTGTKKEEIIQFVKQNKGKSVIIHYEYNIIPSWGDDEETLIVILTEADMQKALNLIETHYIHRIKVV